MEWSRKTVCDHPNAVTDTETDADHTLGIILNDERLDDY